MRWLGIGASGPLEDEGDDHGRAVLRDLAALDGGVLLDDLDPGDAAQGLVGPLEGAANRVLPAVGRRADDLCHACDGHVTYSSRKMIFMSTRYSTICPRSTFTFLPVTSRPVMLRRVRAAR